MSDRQDCDDIRPLLAEVATGAATGPDRAAVLYHTATCEECREQLATLSSAADGLLLLAPAQEPPTGFESAVLARLGEPRPARTRGPHRWPHRPWVRVLAGAAALLLVAGLAGAAVWQSTAGDRNIAEQQRHTLSVAGGQYFAAMPVTTSTGVHTGTVFLYEGSPSWMLVTLAGAPVDGQYQMTVVDRDGVAHPGGACQVQNGDTVEGYQLYRPVSDVALVHLDGPGGVRLTARAA